MSGPRGTPLVRLLRHFEKNDATGCWNWTGSRLPSGYGQFQSMISGHRCGLAHRASWLLHRGPIPPNHFVCHRCDNPSCINPDHLFVGTHGMNMADMMAKGRGCAGERSRAAKLNEDNVREIRASAETNRGLALKFGVAPSLIRQVRNGKIWRRVGV